MEFGRAWRPPTKIVGQCSYSSDSFLLICVFFRFLHVFPMTSSCYHDLQRQTILVIEPPLNYKMVFDGPTNMAAPKASATPIAMSLFPHARGASVCAPLYEHYVAEDGRCYHL